MKEVQYHWNLYLGSDIDSFDLKKIKDKLNKNPVSADLYLITRALNKSDQLDIYHSKYLIQKFYADHPPYIIGIAKSRADAIALVEQIVQECVAARKDADLIAYLCGD